jgi:endoribonuclease Dicer
MKGHFKPVDHNQKVFEELHSSPNDFGILTSKRLPELAKMSFFVSLGEVHVQIAKEPMVVFIQDEQQRKSLTNFHNMIFRDMLDIWKSFFSSTADSYLIVPTCCGQAGREINWKLVEDFQNLQKPRELNETERRLKMQRQRPEDYLYKVINPWYRGEVPGRQYVVTKVHEELTPMSEFPNSSYENYAEYYLDKYAKRIMVPDQFMIEVKGISTYVNLLSPGAGEAGKAMRYSEWTNTESKC